MDAFHPVTRRIVENGDDVSIEIFSRGVGPSIVLLPALARGAEDFEEIARRLAEAGMRVLAPQPRGIGASQGPLEGLTLHDLAGDVAAVIEGEAAGPAIVVGHAYGNFVARVLATDRPDLVRAVVILAGSSGLFVIPSDVDRSVHRSGDLSLPRDERLRCLQHGFFAPGHDPSVWLDGWHPDVMAAQDKARKDMPGFLEVGGAPVLDLQAANDTVAPLKYAHTLREKIGDRVTTVIIPDAGHAVVAEQPAAVAEAIIAYVRKLPRPS